MTKKSQLTENDEHEICLKIAKKTHDYMRKIILRELDYAEKNYKVEPINIANIIIFSLSSLDANIIMMLKKVLDKSSSAPIPLYLLIANHFEGVIDILDVEDKKKLRERMN